MRISTTIQQKTTSTTVITTHVCQQPARFMACSSSARFAARDAAPKLCSTAPYACTHVSAGAEASQHYRPAWRAHLNGVEDAQRVSESGF